MKAKSGLASNGVRNAAHLLWLEMRLQYVHRKACRKAKQYVGCNPLKLHLGCGKVIKPNWVNIDIWSWVADLRLDLREPFPFPDGSASIVYAEHLFEHLEFPGEAKHFLSESLRVLQPGGRLAIGVPDTEWPIRAYATGENEYFEYVRARWHPAWCDTRMHNINFHFRQGSEHKYAYDYETLERVLSEAGFVSVGRREYDPELDSDPKSRQRGTLYVDARKPGSNS